ncbi:helix-hairpin-helix domain-containing protein [Campylobacter sp. 46490-21]|uniref:ComEA family DNA-binding protein n=1 Tax=Campylobacter magnus TaxID=3026462 RepID=UPI00235E4584|nr:helix-hairpin-helix domain-containing protein [Campylobacter magnus]MDD0847595.1 helix-hairpin-helix domain-containing protein [Campylobacter magnus]
MKKLLLLIAMLASLAFAAVDINTASKEELMSLKGIGTAKAEAIIAARPFTSTDEIKKVKGIGEGIYNNIKDEIIVK